MNNGARELAKRYLELVNELEQPAGQRHRRWMSGQALYPKTSIQLSLGMPFDIGSLISDQPDDILQGNEPGTPGFLTFYEYTH
jgi:hypothetical protein